MLLVTSPGIAVLSGTCQIRVASAARIQQSLLLIISLRSSRLSG